MIRERALLKEACARQTLQARTDEIWNLECQNCHEKFGRHSGLRCPRPNDSEFSAPPGARDRDDFWKELGL